MAAEYYTYMATNSIVTLNPTPLEGIGGRIVTFSGPSGVGKTTITEALHTPGRYEKVGKLTTRAPRRGTSRERHVPLHEIHAAKQAGDFLYFEAYDQEHHLLPLVPVRNLLVAQTAVLLETPTVAARALKKHLPDQVTTVYVNVPDPYETLPSRMRARGDTDGTIQRRMADFRYINAQRKRYDVVVYNPDAHDESPSALYTVRSLLESI